jgi:hypothetical protein
MPTIDGRRRVQRMKSLSFSDGERKIHTFIGESVASCTIKDVARLAEVSTATVSRVVNDAKSVSRETRARVLSVISRLRYCRNANAAGLGQTNAGIPRKHEIHLPISANLGTNMLSRPQVDTHNKDRRTERLRLMEDENARLRQVVIDLTIDLERWRSIAQSATKI